MKLLTYMKKLLLLIAMLQPIVASAGDGDVNGDGVVNAADIVEGVNYIMGNPSEKFNMAAADVNGDGVVNAADIVEITKIIMDENPLPQENIEDFIDVSKLSNLSDWHYIPWSKEPEEFKNNVMPDWVLYAAAQTALPPHDLLFIYYAKWNDMDVYHFSSLWESSIFYDENGNWIGEHPRPEGFSPLEFHELRYFITEAEPFDPTSMFGQRINSELVGEWKREVVGKDGKPSYTECREFRSNGSGRSWREVDGVKTNERRFLYTIVDGPSEGNPANWIVVKEAWEDSPSKMVKYPCYIVDGDSMNYAKYISPYFETSSEVDTYYPSSYHRVTK